MSTNEVTTPRGWVPAVTLMILAPVIAEVLSGATRLSYIFALIPEILVWGGGALLIREIVHRWGGGWTSVLLLALGLAVAEEFLIQQTSLAPLPWLKDQTAYGRALGVNWVYFLYMLGYESVWVVLVPLKLIDLLFPRRRDQRWLRTGELVLVGILFLLGASVAWFAWTQNARPLVFHVARYVPPVTAVVVGVLAIALLAVGAYILRNSDARAVGAARTVPSPWLVAPATLLFGFVWYGLIALVFVPAPSVPFWIPIIAGVAWASFAFLVLRRWTALPGWGDTHGWALISSAILVSMAAGYLGSNTWPRVDLIGKEVLNIIAAVLLLLLGRKILHSARRRSARLMNG